VGWGGIDTASSKVDLTIGKQKVEVSEMLEAMGLDPGQVKEHRQGDQIKDQWSVAQAG
jgi:hypothetical protein